MTFNQITRHGQSLIEVLIAVAVGGILVGGSAALIAVILQSGTQNKYFQAASLLAQELVDKAAVLAERDWYCSGASCTDVNGYTVGIYNISQKGSGGQAVRYQIGISGTGFGWKSAAEIVVLDTVDYSRYFYIQNICRGNKGVGSITGLTQSSGPNGVGSGTTCQDQQNDAADPSTQKVTVVVSWTDTSGNTRNVQFERYLTRSRNLITRQTDWSGQAIDPPETVPATSETKNYNTATNIDNTTPGVIKIQGF